MRGVIYVSLEEYCIFPVVLISVNGQYFSLFKVFILSRSIQYGLVLSSKAALQASKASLSLSDIKPYS